MPEIIQDSGGGLMYDNRSRIAHGHDQLLNDSCYRDRLGAAGHKALEQNWSADAHLKSYFALIDEIARLAAAR